MHEVAPDLNDELIQRAADRFSITNLDRGHWFCGFRLHEVVYVAELSLLRQTDKLSHNEVHFKLNIYSLDTQDTEKVSIKPKLPSEKRARRILLPKKVLVLTRDIHQRVAKEAS